MYEPKFLGWRDEPEIDITYLDHLTGEQCKRCDRDLVLKKWWSKLSQSQRNSFSRHMQAKSGRGLCVSCYAHLQKVNPDALLDYERTSMSAAVFVDEYLHLKEQGCTDQLIAEQLGLIKKSGRFQSSRMDNFYKKIDRAKKKGLL